MFSVRKNIFYFIVKNELYEPFETQQYEENKKEIQTIKSYQHEHWRKKI